MMKKLLVFCGIGWLGMLLGAELITPDSFVQNYSRSFKTSGFAMTDKVLCIKGIPEKGEAANGNQKLIAAINLPPSEVANAKCILEFEMKIVQNSGKVDVCLRTVNAKGSSLGYPGFTFRKWNLVPEWQKFSKSIAVPAQAAKLYFFIWARYLNSTDQVLIRNLKVTKL